jgi:group I intron endonuclease
MNNNPSDLPTASGIYQIDNLITGYSYIGSSTNIRQRFYEHRSMLRRGVHFCKHLQRSWNKHGMNNFHMVVVSLCDAKNLIEQEKRIILSRANLYNSELPNGSTWLGKKHTPETIEKIKAARAKQVISKESRIRARKTLKQVNPNHHRDIIKKYWQDVRDGVIERKAGRPVVWSDEDKKKIGERSKAAKRKKSKRVRCLNTGNEYDSAPEMCEKLNLKYKMVWRVLSGQRPHYKGLKFEYILD